MCNLVEEHVQCFYLIKIKNVNFIYAVVQESQYCTKHWYNHYRSKYRAKAKVKPLQKLTSCAHLNKANIPIRSHPQSGLKVSVAFGFFRTKSRNSCISNRKASALDLVKKLVSSLLCSACKGCLYSLLMLTNGSWKADEQSHITYKQNLYWCQLQFQINQVFSWYESDWLRQTLFYLCLTLFRRSIVSDFRELSSCHNATQCFKLHLLNACTQNEYLKVSHIARKRIRDWVRVVI